MAGTKLCEFRKTLIYFFVLLFIAACSEDTSKNETSLEK